MNGVMVLQQPLLTIADNGFMVYYLPKPGAALTQVPCLQGQSDANPLGIAPFLAYRFGTSGVYLQTADMVALYDWNTKGILSSIRSSLWESLGLGKSFMECIC